MWKNNKDSKVLNLLVSDFFDCLFKSTIYYFFVPQDAKLKEKKTPATWVLSTHL